MRMNRSSMGLLFALGCTLSACGGSTDDGLNDSQESLRRGKAVDDGAVRGDRGDRDDDVDEDSDEASDGGHHHLGRGEHEGRGLLSDGGCGFGRRHGDDDDDDRDDDHGGDRGGNRGPKDHGDAGVRGGKGGPGRGGKDDLPFHIDGGRP